MPVLRTIEASKDGKGPLIRVDSTDKRVVSKVGAFTCEYGIRGRELELLLAKMRDKFVRDMELRGLTLVPIPGNPAIVTNRYGQPLAHYALDWEEEHEPSEELDRKGKGRPTKRGPMSLDDSKGLVEYRFVGVFLAPEASIEVLTTRDAILAQEKAKRNPTSFVVERKWS